jgi:hypothetical protein
MQASAAAADVQRLHRERRQAAFAENVERNQELIASHNTGLERLTAMLDELMPALPAIQKQFNSQIAAWEAQQRFADDTLTDATSSMYQDSAAKYTELPDHLQHNRVLGEVSTQIRHAVSQVANAIHPYDYLAAWVQQAVPGSDDRRFRAGLVAAIVAALLQPGPAFNAQATSDERARLRRRM